MTTEVQTALALKEWAALIDMMSRGVQAIALRKGGIREKAFLVQGHRFYLLPTFAHESAELIKPEFRDGVEQAANEQRDEAGLIVQARADLVDFWEIDDEARVNALQPFHIYTDQFVAKRFNWRPKQPLTVMLLRVYRLERRWQTDLAPGVGGCRSWFEFDASAAPVIAEPALDEPTFARLSTNLQRLLG